MLILFIIIIILFILWSYKKLSNKISKYYISRNSFNNIFNSNIIILPESITAFGFDNNKYYIYNQYGIFSDQLSQKRINTFRKPQQQEKKNSNTIDGLTIVHGLWDVNLYINASDISSPVYFYSIGRV